MKKKMQQKWMIMKIIHSDNPLLKDDDDFNEEEENRRKKEETRKKHGDYEKPITSTPKSGKAGKAINNPSLSNIEEYQPSQQERLQQKEKNKKEALRGNKINV